MPNHTVSCDIAVVGGGVLGVSTAFWLSEIYDCNITLVEKEHEVALHTTKRNTGVIHRPFYLNPEKKKIIARSAEKSYHLWKKLAFKHGLPWKQVGTLEVASTQRDLNTLEEYLKWGQINGMLETEIEILNSSQVKSLEPQVSCASAIHSKTDTSVDFSDLTKILFRLAVNNGVKLLGGATVKSVNEGHNIEIETLNTDGSQSTVICDFMVNAAGGGSVDIAHMTGVAQQYTDLHFRGEYWKVDEPFASKVSRNIYSVPKYKEFPFLDPHFIVKHNGVREIGPNAVLVSGPTVYHGVSSSFSELVQKVVERPFTPKAKMFANRRFIELAWNEWWSSMSKKAMCSRASKFVPSLKPYMLTTKGLAGVRSSLIDGQSFIPEAICIYGERSLHLLNYNSPGATGAPAFSAHLVADAQTKGHLDSYPVKVQPKHKHLWLFEDAANLSETRLE